MLHVHLKSLYSVFLECNVLKITVNHSIVYFRISVALLIFCLEDPCIDKEWGVTLSYYYCILNFSFSVGCIYIWVWLISVKILFLC